MPYSKRRKTMVVQLGTKLKDLKVGDLVTTAEVHRVVKVRDAEWIEVAPVLPQCSVCGKKCLHTHVMHVGYGQQGVLKVLKGVE